MYITWIMAESSCPSLSYYVHVYYIIKIVLVEATGCAPGLLKALQLLKIVRLYPAPYLVIITYCRQTLLSP